jgi:4-hydroxyisophthalate hydroxylase
VVIERYFEPQRIPKGQNLTQRTLEHFYFWGIADELRKARVMPPEYPSSGIIAYGNMMSEYWAAPPYREVVRPYYYQANDRLPQYATESVLRRRLSEVPQAEILFGWSADQIEQHANGVKLTIIHRETNEKRVLEADYLVGCDGSHSSVRGQVGIERGGSDFDQLMVLAVFRSKELHEIFNRFPGRSTYLALHPDFKGYWQFFGRIDVGEGWFFHAPVPRDTTKDNYDFKALLYRAVGREFACEFDHVGFWDLRVAVAEKYQVGRVFIAGDAAHSHPPYGGFGLNNGLEDARNLGWKIAATLQGWGGAGLLDSYSEERRPIFKETGEDFIAAGIERDRKLLETYHPERDRAAFEKAWNDRMTGAGSRAVVYEPNYEGSSIVLGPPGGKCSAHGTHTFAARAGHHLAPRTLSNGRDVYQELGEGFTLIAFDAPEASIEAFSSAAKNAGVPFKVIRDNFKDGREAYEKHLVLVRPDQYVVWAGDTAPANAASVIAKVRGAA